MEFFLYITVFLFGNLFGSFFNVCIHRIPKGESVVTPPSHCPKCGYSIKWYDNIPIISYFILLRGKCRSCKEKINIRYPLIEILTGVLFTLVFHKYFMSIDTVKYIIFVSFLVILTFIDLEHYALPDMLTYPMLATGVMFWFLEGKEWQSLLIGIGVYSILFLVLFAIGEYIIKKDIMGFGDVKLGVAIGSYLGYTGFVEIYLFYMLSFCLGAVIGVALIIMKIKSRKDMIPFGPYIAVSAILLVLAGGEMRAALYMILGM